MIDYTPQDFAADDRSYEVVIGGGITWAFCITVFWRIADLEVILRHDTAPSVTAESP